MSKVLFFNRNFSKFFIYFKNHLLFFLFTFCLFSGVLIGSIFSFKQSSVNLEFLFNDFLHTRKDNSLLSIFLLSFLSELPYLISSVLSGFFVFGFVIDSFIPFLKGLGIGILCGYIYLLFGLKGFAFCVIIIIPVSLFFSLIIIKSCVGSFLISRKLYSVVYSSSLINMTDYKLFLFAQLKYLFFLIIVSFCDSIISSLFISVISF